MQIKVEGGELVLKNEYGDLVIVPKEYAHEVQGMLDENCMDCLNKFIANLPKLEE